MRREYDKKMVTGDPATVVRDVIQTQPAIIKELHGREDAVPCKYATKTKLPTEHLTSGLELLILYKEVQEQYEGGRLEVPEDVTLLFADDNFGTVRRLLHQEETKSKGGAGVRTTLS
jgi:hypothetical protein